MTFDLTLLTAAVLTSPPGQFAMIVAITQALKEALFWYNNEWRDRLVPLLAGVVGILYGTVCARLTGGDPASAGLLGLGLAMVAVGFYRPVVGPVVGAVSGLLGRRDPS